MALPMVYNLLIEHVGKRFLMSKSTIQLDPSFRASLSRYLDAELIENLHERRVYNKASRHLNTLQVNLASYLPKYIADREDLLNVEYSDLRRGTFMFADVSGFTALSEKLERATGGIEGAEIMTQIINDFFSTMLEILAKSDGQMLKFAGDALLTFFPVTEDETHEDPQTIVAAKAIRTGLRMQRSMQERFQPIQHPLLVEFFGEDHDIELTMSIGIARGRLFEALVGNSSQRDHMIMGKLPGQADAAEAAGVRNDVIIDAALAEVFKDEFTLIPAAGDPSFFQVVDDLGEDLSDFELTSIVSRRRSSAVSSLMGFGLDEVDPIEELRHQVARVDNYARFVAQEVVNKLAIEGDRVEPQNRPATVIFGYFRGIADILEEWGEEELPRITHILNRFYGAMQQVIAAYGGSLTRSDPYRDGCKLLITFGAPIAHPDDPFRAVATCLEMQHQVSQFNAALHKELPPDLQRDTYIEMRMGVTHGQAFAGEVGWKQRREYTVMGDDVNLAARLMGKSSMGDIWISERVHNRVERFFRAKALEPMQMKGKTEPIQAYAVTEWKGASTDISRTSNTRFIGRDTLLLTLDFALEQARANRVRTIALVGFVGIGKTRIAKQFLQQAQNKGFKTAWATSHPMDTATVTWDVILSQLFALDADAPLSEREAAFQQQALELGLVELMTPLDEVLFGEERLRAGVHQHHRHSTGEFEVRLSMEMNAAVVKTVQAIAQQSPTLIVLDDIDRGHPAAIDILMRLVKDVKRGKLIVMLCYEPGFVLDINHTLIEDLSQDETFRIATDILHVPELGNELCAALWKQSHGRPLFVEAMLQKWQEEEMVAIAHGVAELSAGSRPHLVPDYIRNLIISGVDQLSVEQQLVLQAASVLTALDDEMTMEMLVEVMGHKEPHRAQAAILDMLESQILKRGDDSLLYLPYGLVQQVVYESLTRLQRQRMHGAAADFLHSLPDAEAHFNTIAQHLVRGGKPTRALEMLEGAASAAEDAGDVERAMSYYEQALELFPNDRTLQTALSRIVKRAAAAVISTTEVPRQPMEEHVEPMAPEPSDAETFSLTGILRTVLGESDTGKTKVPTRPPCPNPDCPDYGTTGGNNIIKAGKTRKGTQRYKCKTCGKTFSERAG